MSVRSLLLTGLLVMVAGAVLGIFVALPRSGEPKCLSRMQWVDSIAFISVDPEAWCEEG